MWIYGSGKPYWQPTISFLRNNQGLIRNFEINSNDKIVYDLPTYSRLDISGAYKFGSERVKAEVGFSILNLLDTKNVRGKRLDIGLLENSRGKPNAPRPDDLFRDQELLGFTPSFFFNIKF